VPRDVYDVQELGGDVHSRVGNGVAVVGSLRTCRSGCSFAYQPRKSRAHYECGHFVCETFPRARIRILPIDVLSLRGFGEGSSTCIFLAIIHRDMSGLKGSAYHSVLSQDRPCSPLAFMRPGHFGGIAASVRTCEGLPQ
jgi:hypothetical protein